MSHPEFYSPIILLHEADGFVVTIETKTGEIYRGILEGSEDTMNCELKDVTFTNKEGIDTHLENVYIRGSNIRFFILPDILANSPMFLEKSRIIKGHADGYAGNLRDKSLAHKIKSQFT